MRKPNGHLNLLDVTVDGRCKKFNTIQKVLNDNKDNIAALHILPGNLTPDFTSFLQHENTRFKFLEELTICKFENSNFQKSNSKTIIIETTLFRIKTDKIFIFTNPLYNKIFR